MHSFRGILYEDFVFGEIIHKFAILLAHSALEEYFKLY